MALSSTKVLAGERRVALPQAVGAAPRPSIVRPLGGVAAKATAWDSWTSYMGKRGSSAALLKKTAEEKNISKELAAIISKSAVGFKPKFGGDSNESAVSTTDFKLTHVGSINLDDLPSDLHERLEAIGSLQLKQVLGMEDKELDFASISFTTTDVDAALCVTGVTLQQGLNKTALLSVVATEPERELSWSRLEGLVFHWAGSDASGGAWSMPPQGWTAVPAKTVDAGGAWQCAFEKQMFSVGGGSKAIFNLLLQVPLRGVLKSGGIIFVLKATAGQNTRWLKDEASKKDFFIDLQVLPVIKA